MVMMSLLFWGLKAWPKNLLLDNSMVFRKSGSFGVPGIKFFRSEVPAGRRFIP